MNYQSLWMTHTSGFCKASQKRSLNIPVDFPMHCCCNSAFRVEELAEIFAIEFCPNEVTYLVESWRPENAEEAVLSACSSLIVIIDDRGSKIVQFPHFSAKEYMTSDRLQRSDVSHPCDYYIPLELAHTILGRACIEVLLQLDEKVDRERVATFPLVKYVSKHWLDHAKFENIQSQIQDDSKHLFDPKRPHLRACNWLHDIGRTTLVPTPSNRPYSSDTPILCGVLWVQRAGKVAHHDACRRCKCSVS